MRVCAGTGATVLAGERLADVAVTCTVGCEREALMQIIKGEVDPMNALMTGQVTVDDLGQLMAFKIAFSFFRPAFNAFLEEMRRAAAAAAMRRSAVYSPSHCPESSTGRLSSPRSPPCSGAQPTAESADETCCEADGGGDGAVRGRRRKGGAEGRRRAKRLREREVGREGYIAR